MADKNDRPAYGARCIPIDLSSLFNWPPEATNRPPRKGGPPASEGSEAGWWEQLAEEVRSLPQGPQKSWGVPFRLSDDQDPRVILLAAGAPEVKIPLSRKASYLCFLHGWCQTPDSLRREDPQEGLVVGRYTLFLKGGGEHVQPIRGRFEVEMAESPGPAWLAVPFQMPETVDPEAMLTEMRWGRIQTGVARGSAGGRLLHYALPNPLAEKELSAVSVAMTSESPLIIAGLTLYQGSHHPLQQLPRRSFRVSRGGKPVDLESAEVDFGVIAREEKTFGSRDKEWLASACLGTRAEEPEAAGESLLEIVATPDASLSVRPEGRENAVSLSVGQAFHEGTSTTGPYTLEILGPRRQWVTVRVLDASTGKPTPVRAHFSGSHGEYLPPYGHHAQINANWFEDYGADVVVGGRNYAYVPGEFTTDIPAGDVYVELYKGFEYEPVRKRLKIKPGQKSLELSIRRWKDLRAEGWVTADTHVHFISPQTAWLEGQAEGVNVVNLLASQWGRLFTNVGDLTGRPGVVQDDTVVFVGTENRNHMLGHMSMLGTQGLPVYPMCAGGPNEAWVGDPEFRMLAEWALENRRKGGVVIRPHYPFCGNTEDPVPILKGLVDALEIGALRGGDYPTQEWYRYLNCGYRVAVAGGTDKMGAYTALGWLRTYAKLDPNVPFTYASWAAAVRAGRTFSTTGPLMDLVVDGKSAGETIQLGESGGTVEVEAVAHSFWPLSSLEVICNGRVAASEKKPDGTKLLRVREKITVTASGWIAARCSGLEGHPAGYMAAHTSPVYLKCGETRAFDGPAAEHMLALVEGGIEYLNTLAILYDESSRKRMAQLFHEARLELRGRLVLESGHHHHAPEGRYHTHGHGSRPDHTH